MKVSVILTIFVYGFMLSAPYARAQSLSKSEIIQSLPDIQQAVKAFVETSHAVDNRLSVSVKALDKRLRLNQCEEPLTAQWASGSRQLGRVTVKVSCASPKPWRIHVQAKVTMDGMVWSLVRGVQRGDVMSKNLLARKSVVLGSDNRFFAPPIVDIDPWLGFVFTKRVSAGKILDERMLEPALVVIKGKAVLIRHNSAGLSLSTNGIAMENASLHERVKVRNPSSGKVIDAIAVSRDIVEIVH